MHWSAKLMCLTLINNLGLHLEYLKKKQFLSFHVLFFFFFFLRRVICHLQWQAICTTCRWLVTFSVTFDDWNIRIHNYRPQKSNSSLSFLESTSKTPHKHFKKYIRMKYIYKKKTKERRVKSNFIVQINNDVTKKTQFL